VVGGGLEGKVRRASCGGEECEKSAIQSLHSLSGHRLLLRMQRCLNEN